MFNILLLGRKSVGKSTLLNILYNCKCSLEGKGELGTKKIIRYNIKKYNLSLTDTPGLESDEDKFKIKDLIEDLNGHLLKKKFQFHLVFFSINDRRLSNIETDVVNILFKYNIPLFFLVTNDLNKLN